MLQVQIRKERRAGRGVPFVLDVSMEAPVGITILFGASGSGKSTLLDCITGLVAPDAGRIALEEQTLFDSSSRTNIPTSQRRMAYVFQSLALFPHLTVEENVAYGLNGAAPETRKDQVSAILAAFRVEELGQRKPNQLSGGEQQRIALARSLVTQPRALLLDEPLSGLDAELRSAIVEDLRAWNAANRIPILFVTHSREEVDALGERVVALENGRVVSSGLPMEVLAAPRRRKLAQTAGFENLLNAVVLDHREADGVMRVRLVDSNCEIEVPLGYAPVGSPVHIAVRAGDILLATERPQGLSARNVLEGRISSLEHRGTMVVARVDAGVLFIVHLTPGALRALELAEGRGVWLVLKTHSCHLVE